MAENGAEIAAGAAVLAAAVGFVLYAGQLTGFSGSPAGYTVAASFRAADGVSVGTDVRLAGVRVGSVSAIALNPQTFAADAILTIDGTIALPDDTAALISQEGLLGGTFVELLPGGSPDDIPPGGTIRDTQGSVSLVTLRLRAVGGSAEPEP